MKTFSVATRDQAVDLTIRHLTNPVGHGYVPANAFTASAGSPECGNKVHFHIVLDSDRVADAGFEEDGCETLMVVGSMIVERIIGQHIFDAALISLPQINAELGGLPPVKLRAAELVLDSMAVALGRATYQTGSVEADPGRTLVAMSGGVDSSVVAVMAREAGGTPVAVTLELWRDAENDEESSCCSITAVRAARQQAHNLDIPHFTLDLRAEFAEGVVKPFINAYRDGKTPNPCVSCNGDVRLDAMVDMADRLGAATLSTGHYARITNDGEGPLLAAAADPKKDQTFMLAAVKPSILQRLKFPLGANDKTVTRAIANKHGLVSANLKDSQDLCFLAGTSRSEFLARHGKIISRPGDIVDTAGNTLATHQGVDNFTIGQRKGLGISWKDEPWFVIRIDPGKSHVIVGKRADLSRMEVSLRGVRLHRDSDRVTHVRLRYHSEAVPCTIDVLTAGRHPRATVVLKSPTENFAPGQSAQLLCGDLVVGQAIIGR